MNTHHLNDRVVLIHSILQYQFIQTDRCLNKDTSQTLKSNKHKSRSSSRVTIHSLKHTITYYFQVGGSCSVLL